MIIMCQKAGYLLSSMVLKAKMIVEL